MYTGTREVPGNKPAANKNVATMVFNEIELQGKFKRLQC
jgi:hypothetical protein